MSLRRLALLAVILLAVAGYYYVIEHRGQPERARREAEAKQLFHFEPDAAATLTLQEADSTLALAKQEGRWRVVAPVDERADEITVSGVLHALSALTPVRALEDPQGLAEYGLDPPDSTVTVEDEAGAALATLHLGDLNPDHTHRFLRAADSAVVGLVPVRTYDSIAKSLFDLRSKQWTTLLAADVTRLTLRGPADLHIALIRDEGGDWLLAGEPARHADQASVRALLNRLLNARVAQFFDDPEEVPQPNGLEAPGRTALFTTEGAQGELQFGSEVPDATPAQRYARTGDDARVLVLADTVLTAWPDTGDDLRDRSLLRFTRAAVSTIRLRTAGETVTISRDAPEADAWTLDGPEPQPADPAEIGALLGQLERLEASRFLHVGEEPGGPADFEAAPVEVELVLADDALPVRVRFAQGEATDTWYAMRAGDPEVYPVDDYRVTGLQLGRDDFLDTRLLRFERAAVQRIDVLVGDRALRYTRKSDDTWRPGPGAPRLDRQQITQLLQDLTDLHYTALLPADDPALAEPPAFAVIVRDVAGDELAAVRLGGRIEGDDGAVLYAADAGGMTASVDGRLAADWLPVFTDAP